MPHTPLFNLSSVRGVILDWDGVIAETKLDFGPVRRKYFNGKHVPLLEAAETMDVELKTAFLDEIRAEEMRGAANSVPVEGIFDFIKLLDSRHIRWCILSRNCMESINLAAQCIKFKLPPYTFSREAKHVKPDPRAMTDAADSLEVSYSKCLVVGDYLFEMLGARRAGMRCVLVRTHDAESLAMADGYYSDLKALTQAFENADSLIPWEYQPAAALLGKKILSTMAQITVHIDCHLKNYWLEILDKLASFGLGMITADVSSTLGIDEFRNCGTLSPASLSRSLCDILQQLYGTRYPLLEIRRGNEGIPLSSLSSPEKFIQKMLSE
jgi:HAD superfamily hydrolase (TIGR01509 family)